MERQPLFQGRIWVLLDREGNLIEDIDTDQIYHNAHLHITDISEMGQHALGNLEDWKDFPGKCRTGDIILAGRNFGAGSSRQQAVDCFIALGVAAVMAPSYSAIYFRNAVNSGFPVLKMPGLRQSVADGKFESGDIIRVDALQGEGRNQRRDIAFMIEPMSSVQHDIFKSGNLFRFGRE